jgi:hypothetical protein
MDLRRIAPLTLLGLTAFATSTAAKCAWVLWWAEGPGFTWSVDSAYETHDSCLREARSMAEKTVEHWKVMGGEVLSLQRGSGWTFLVSKELPSDTPRRVTGPDPVRIICLPDTADPRGPKGRAR